MNNTTPRLVYVLHGYTLSPARYSSIKRVVESCYPEASVLVPKLPLNTWSMEDPNNIVQKVLNQIDKDWAVFREKVNSPELPKIILIGHSTGALLARKVYVCACGENSDAPFEKVYATTSIKPWAKQVERVILFAGMNRGWTLNQHLYHKTAFMIRIGLVLGHLLSLFGAKPLAFHTRRGASFITQLRIQWLSMQRHRHKGVGDAMVIQLLGTVDDLISPEDDIDLVTGNKFIYLDVPLSDHLNVLDMEAKTAGPKRREVFVKALTESQQALKKIQMIPSDNYVNAVDETVTDVVFVVHGIRDTGYWTQKVARRVKALGDADKGKKFAMETSSYGYFPMLPFLLFSRRRAKVEWLMDQYTENLAHYPNAKFSFIGHSNGTYLLAKALKEYPACKFKHVIFAGSVVSQNYDWRSLIEQERVGKIYNLVAASDWVVACFPKSLQRLRLQDLGSAGYDGFSGLEDSHQWKYIPGTHGAALEERYWDDMARFIVKGIIAQPTNGLQKQERSAFMKLLGGLAPLPLLLVAICLLIPIYTIWQARWGVEYQALVTTIYLLIVWKIVTWV